MVSEAYPWMPRGNGSCRPRVVSAVSRFGPGSFRPESFRPGSIRPWVVSPQFGGSFRPIFSQLSGLLPKINLIHFRLVGECMVLVKALGWFKHIHEQHFSVNNS